MTPAELPGGAQRFSGQVASLLFDGANSAVLVTEETTRAEIRIALPQTGRFADLKVGETIAFGFDAQQRGLLPRVIVRVGIAPNAGVPESLICVGVGYMGRLRHADFIYLSY